mmetsp:Transcript_54417/g.111058  ORF Transcript_54417/g.111058 Transcript_54417/m.111058 type:complete len:279 (+) Transcript_54417:60-896(+)
MSPHSLDKNPRAARYFRRLSSANNRPTSPNSSADWSCAAAASPIMPETRSKTVSALNVLAPASAAITSLVTARTAWEHGLSSKCLTHVSDSARPLRLPRHLLSQRFPYLRSRRSSLVSGLVRACHVANDATPDCHCWYVTVGTPWVRAPAEWSWREGAWDCGLADGRHETRARILRHGRIRPCATAVWLAPADTALKSNRTRARYFASQQLSAILHASRSSSISFSTVCSTWMLRECARTTCTFCVTRASISSVSSASSRINRQTTARACRRHDGGPE